MAITLGAFIAFSLIVFDAHPKYGPLEEYLGKPFHASLLVTDVEMDSGKVTAVCQILNKSNHNVLVRFYSGTTPKQGDLLEVYELTLNSPADYNSDSDFYNRYLKGQNIRYTSYLSEGKYSITAENYGQFPAKQARMLNNFIKDRIDNIYSHPRTAGFLKGIILGGTESLTDDEVEVFSNAGSIHIVSVSGFHVMLLLSILQLFIKRFKVLFKNVIIFIFLIFLIFLTGCSPSVIRACVMVMITISASYFRKDKSTENALYLVGLFLIIYNRYIIYNVSFILSFSATFGIIKCYGPFMRYFKFMPSYLQSVCATTLSAQLGVLPAMMYFFQKTTLFSVIPNLAISFIIPILFVLTPVSLIFNFDFLTGVCNTLCDFIYYISSFTASLPFNTINIKTTGFVALVVTGVVLWLCHFLNIRHIKHLQKNIKEDHFEYY